MAGQTYQEGTIADGPNGPLVFQGGAWVPLAAGPATGPQPVTIGTRNATKAAMDQLALQKAIADAKVAAQTAPVEQAIKQAQLNNLTNPRSAPPSGYRYKENGDLEKIPGGPIVGQNGVKQSNGALDAIVSQINDVSRMFANGVGDTKGLAGLEDYLPSSANSAFDAAAAGLEDQAAMAFRVPGSGTVSDADAARIARANKPDRFALDAANRQRLHQLRLRVDAARQAAGLPAAQWASDQKPDASTTYRTDQQAGDNRSIATGAYRRERDPETANLVDSMIRAGATPDAINAALSAQGKESVDPAEVAKAQEYLRKNPGYKGGFTKASKVISNSFGERLASSPFGTGVISAGNAVTANNLDSLAGMAGYNPADIRAGIDLGEQGSPNAALAGNIIGGTTGALALEGAGGLLAGGRLAAWVPRLADAAYGGASGAGAADGPGESRLAGAGLGAVTGLGGGEAGRRVATGLGSLLARAPKNLRLSSADKAILTAVEDAGPDVVQNSLQNADNLNVPLSLADIHPTLRELGGAAVRRSPVASSIAEDALMPRALGQYDRLTSSVQRELGPTVNIPQQSAEMMGQARAAAADLYTRAYGNRVPSTPELDAVLGTPFGRQALGRARTIAANERRNPMELGFALDDAGNTVLNPMPAKEVSDHLFARQALNDAQEAYRVARQTTNGDVDAARRGVEAARANLRRAETALSAAPEQGVAASVPAYTTQTLDYVKRGMDDVLEEQRNPITGRLVLDEAGRAQNQVRGQLLDEVDRLNPDFAAARQVYAGPMASRDALSRGADAYGLHPDELGMQVAGQSPEHITQMQLGYRGALVDHAGRVRDASNPWDATLGSPTARSRLQTMYPDSPGVGRMLQQLDLERQMGATKNAVLGNSRTARNQIADQAFATSPLVEGALHTGAAVATHGASLLSPALQFVKDRIALGLGEKAVAKANEIAPVLFDTNPVSSSRRVAELLARRQAIAAAIGQAKSRYRLAAPYVGALGAGGATQLIPTQ